MSIIFQKARELGEAIHESEPFQKMIELEKQIEADAEAKRLTDMVTSMEGEVRTMMSDGSADREAMNEMVAEFKEARARAEANPLLSEHRQAQGEFARLMQQVNEVLGFFVTGKVSSSAGCGGGCGGNCGGCSGSCADQE
jgi:cell fate (sporulation/competence/biofilm development) regulator YlbF (YheA/YmcA/DUF963 family)